MLLLLTFFSFFYTVFIGQQPAIPELRQLFFEASESEDKADALFDKVGKYNGTEGILIAYKAGAYALKAKYGANPINKLRNVKKAEDYFSEAVKHDSKNLEIRFMRYAVEVQTPRSLGLSDHIAEDKAILLEGLRKYPKSGFTAETAKITKDFMKQHCDCTDQEKQFVERLKI